MSFELIALIVLVVFIIGCIIMYNSLVLKRNKVKESFASIDVQLKKRYDLIPNILTIAQKYMEHERELLENITALRAQAIQIPDKVENIGNKLQLDGQISKQMGQLMVNMENYPQIKADQTMIQAMQTYNEVEEHIAAARRFYNSAVLDMNNACELFPSSIFALIFNFKQVPFFKVENEAERERIDAGQFFK
ncbi:LemA family protein [bacterium]|nr:LemA family protein [bacterium]